MKSKEQELQNIATRLRGLREALDLSIEEMAEKLLVDSETVKTYESGLAEIPVGYILNAAHACGVDMDVIISGEEARLKGYSLIRKDGGLPVDRRKTYDYKNLAYSFSDRKMEPFLVTVPAIDEYSSEHVNKHPGQEFIYLLEGRLEIVLEGKTFILEPGDSIYFSSELQHCLRGLDDQKAIFLDVISVLDKTDSD